MTLTPKIRDSVWLRDCDGQQLAEFLMLDDGPVIGIPMIALTRVHDESCPLWVPPAIRYQPAGFLGYLAAVAARAHLPYCLSAASRGAQVELTPHMLARDLAAVTGYDLEDVRKHLREFLAFA